MWLLGHLLDASNWYNRNLVIIANIERQFLTDSDQRDIQYYFVHHRPHKMITHLRLQALLGFAVGGVVLWFHFIERVWPGINSPWSNFSSFRALPYVVLVCGSIVVVDLWLRNYYGFTEFKQKSPGIAVADLYPDAEAYGHGRMKGWLAGIRQWLVGSRKAAQGNR
jgi:hypothetical protein